MFVGGCFAHPGAAPTTLPATAYLPTSRPSYPAVARGDVVDDYFGTKIADPYRALEDDASPQTHAFTDAQNKLTRGFLDGALRDKIKSQITTLINFPKYSNPMREGPYYFYAHNDGLQNQSVLYFTRSIYAKARPLLDPNTLSKDGTIAVSAIAFTVDGKLIAYGLSSGGSDQQDIHVRRVADQQDLPDVLQHCKFAGIAWAHDGSGFWYNRYPTPGTVPKEDEARHNKLYWHALGTPQDKDPIVFTPGDKELSADPEISEDGQVLIVYLNRGTAPKNRLYFRPTSETGDFHKLLDKEDAAYSFIDHDGPTFYVDTDLDAPRHKLVAIDVEHPEKSNWKTIIPQSDDAISFISCVNNRFIVGYLHDAHSVVKIFDMRGHFERELSLPGIGSVSGVSGHRDDREMFVTFSSFIDPPAIFRYDFETRQLEVFRKPQIKLDTSNLITKQVFVRSKDGTRVPMFITQKRDLPGDGNNPTLLSAYGGFDVSLQPSFSTSRLLWLENGGVFCQANLRGGGEYGETWHEQGMLDHKQNGFDDFQACAQWLIDHRVTSAKKLAIEGGSNGGLLVAACETQRPDLFGAVLCHVPLTDMLRFQNFTVGRFWTVEYGDATASESQFKTLLKYSPLQNVKPGVAYPATLIFTAEGDDRVAPLHARKFTAALQNAQAGNNPILLRTETRAGHGGGKPIMKAIDEAADGYTFLARIFGIDWK